jgi:hypothetical protein
MEQHDNMVVQRTHATAQPKTWEEALTMIRERNNLPALDDPGAFEFTSKWRPWDHPQESFMVDDLDAQAQYLAFVSAAIRMVGHGLDHWYEHEERCITAIIKLITKGIQVSKAMSVDELVDLMSKAERFGAQLEGDLLKYWIIARNDHPVAGIGGAVIYMEADVSQLNNEQDEDDQ